MCYSFVQTSSERPFEVIFSKSFALSLVFACLGLLRPAYAALDPTSLNSGFHQMYNLDFQGAHKTFETWQKAHPEDPLGATSNAAAYLFSEFARLHMLAVDLFVEDRKPEKTDEVLPDPNIKAAFEDELARADDIAAKVLAQSSNDRNALFAKTLIDGLRGTYAAL